MQTRLAVYSANTYVDVLPTPSDVKWGVVFNDTPTLIFQYSSWLARGGLVAQLLDGRYDVSLEVNYGTGWVEPPSCRFLVLEDSVDVSDVNGMITVTCPGVDYDLTGVVGLDASKYKKSTGKRRFANATPGTFLRTMLNEGQAAGLATAIAVDFTTSHDSAGNAWSKTITLELGPEVTMRQLLDALANQSMCDWRFEGNTLRVFNMDASNGMRRDRTSAVQLAMGRECVDGPQKRSLRDRVEKVMVYGEDGKSWVRTRTTTHPRGARAVVSQQGGVTQQATAYSLADALLDAGANTRTQLTRSLQEHPNGCLPFKDFLPGDLIVAPGYSGKAEDLRVYQISMKWDENNSQNGSIGNVVLNDKFVDRQIRQAKRMDGILGAGTVSGGSSAKPVPPPSKRRPAAPEAPGVTSNAYIPESGVPVGAAYVAWPPVTVDEDGDAIEVEAYTLRVQPYGSDPETDEWASWGGTRDTTFLMDGLQPGSSWNVQVQATSYLGGVGDWSPTSVVTIESDTTAPNTPSAPTVTSSFAMVQVKWNGLDSSGFAMAPDFDRVEVLRTGSATILGTLRSAGEVAYISGLTVGVSYSFYLKAYDTSGNVSGNSATSSVAVVSVLDDPILSDELEDLIIATAPGGGKVTYSTSAASTPYTGTVGDLWYQHSSNQIIAMWTWTGSAWQSMTLRNEVVATLDAGKITTGSLAAARIAAGTISADKLAAGAIDGQVITGATVRTAASGARVQLTSAGLQAFNSGGTNTVTISAIDGSFTATGGTITGALIRTSASSSAARLELNSAGRLRAWGKTGGTVMPIMDIFPYNDDIPGYIGEANFWVPISVPAGIETALIQSGSASTTLFLAGGTADFAIGVSTGGARVSSMAVYNQTSSGAANVRVGSNGHIVRSTSAARYKTDIALSDAMPQGFLEIQPKTWLDLGELRSWEQHLESTGGSGIGPIASSAETAEPPRRHVGFVAEDVEQFLGPDYVDYGPNGEVESILYDRLAVPLYPEVRELKARVAQLEQLLKGRLSDG